MASQNHKMTLAFAFFIFLLLAVKFFTAEIILSDDPTTIFVVKLFPSFDNQITMTPPVDFDGYLNGYLVLFSDENGFVGEGVYHFLVKYLWWCFPLIGLLYYAFKSLTGKGK